MTDVELELVAAVAANGVIGRDGQLPWHLPDDLGHFKSLTMGHPIIMGRRTFESIGRALPGRQSIVVSTTLADPPADGVELAGSVEHAIELSGAYSQPSFVIGGAALYAAVLSRVRVLHLTELDEPFDGDTYFPSFNKDDWRLAEEVRHEADDRHAVGYRSCRYERV